MTVYGTGRAGARDDDYGAGRAGARDGLNGTGRVVAQIAAARPVQ